MITNIKLKNIKGFGDPATSIDLELKTNKVNILFAPNGSGKSSIATAFASLLPRSLKVEKDSMFHKDDALDAELSITMDGITLEANKSKNEITPKLNVCVINSGLAPATTQHNMGKFTSVSGYLDIADIELVSSIPEIIIPNYKITVLRRDFGINGKILPTIEAFQNWQLWQDVESNGTLLSSFNLANYRKQLVEDIKTHIRSLEGTAETLVAQVQDDWFTDLEANEVYANIMAVFSKYADDTTPLARFVLFYQLIYFWENNKDSIKKANKRVQYDKYKHHIDSSLSLLDLTWKRIHTVEVDGKLLVQFPRADEISNGQRDIVTLVSQMLKFKAKIKSGKKYLLIIDELFDYLDDANVIAAQCFLTDFLKLGKGNLYLGILTHLNPYSFKNYIFSDNKVNYIYLFNTQPKGTSAMKAFIAFRQGLDRADKSQSVLYDNLSRDLFHYNPVVVDYCAQINALKKNRHLVPSWGKTGILHTVLIDEVNKYLIGNTSFDPYAVAMAVRLRVEKIMYDNLPTKSLKDGMLAVPMTKNKMKFCEENGFEVSDVFNIVNAIHNEAEHLAFDSANDRFIEKPMVYKLQNRSIHAIIANLFEWHNTPLTTTIID